MLAAINQPSPKVTLRLSENTPKFHQSVIREKYFLSRKLDSLEQQRIKTADYYDDQLSRLNMELHSCIKPRSLDLDRLAIPQQRITDTLKSENIQVPSWIPAIESTRHMVLTEADVGMKVYNVVRRSTCVSSRRINWPPPDFL